MCALSPSLSPCKQTQNPLSYTNNNTPFSHLTSPRPTSNHICRSCSAFALSAECFSGFSLFARIPPSICNSSFVVSACFGLSCEWVSDSSRSHRSAVCVPTSFSLFSSFCCFGQHPLKLWIHQFYFGTLRLALKVTLLVRLGSLPSASTKRPNTCTYTHINYRSSECFRRRDGLCVCVCV